jgi:hypothetical protein
MGEPGYVLGDYGIGAAMEALIAANPDNAGTLYALTAELDLAAEVMLDTTAVYATDVRRGVGASGGVASAHAELLYSPNFMDFAPGSLRIAPAFDLAASGSMNEPGKRIDNAGGSFDLAANGQNTPGARTPQLLFSVSAQVPETTPNVSPAVLRLLPADDINLKTMVYGMDAPVSGDFQVLTLDVGSPWRNPANRWDVNRDGLVNELDELAVLAGLADDGPRKLPETPPTPPRGRLWTSAAMRC